MASGADGPGRADPYPGDAGAGDRYRREPYPTDVVPTGPYAPQAALAGQSATGQHGTGPGRAVSAPGDAYPYPADRDAADPYGSPPVGGGRRSGAHPVEPAGHPYADRPGADPYRPDPYGPDPYGPDPYGPDRYGADPHHADRYAGPGYAAEPLAGDSGGAGWPAYPRARYRTGDPDATGDWRDALPLIDPPPLRPARPRRALRLPVVGRLAGTGRRTAGPAAASAGHRPAGEPAWRDWLDEYRQEAAAVLAVLAAIGVVAMLVLRAVEVPPPVTSTEDLATRASSIPYAEPTGGQNPFPPVPAGSAVLPPFLPPELPEPTAAPAPGRSSARPPGGPAPAPTGAGRPRAPKTKPPAVPPPTRPAPSGRDAYSLVQAESYDTQSGTQTESSHDRDGGQLVGYIVAGDWLRYRAVDFGATPATGMRIRVASGAPGNFRGRMNIRLDSRGSAPIGGITVGNTGDWYAWRTVTTSIAPVTGVHTVYVTFDSDHDVEFMNLNWFTFTR